MGKLTFKGLYQSAKEVIKQAKEPLVLRSNQRAIDSSIDDAEKQKIDAELALQKELEVVGEGNTINVNKVLGYRQTIKNAEATIEELKAFKLEFFEEEK